MNVKMWIKALQVIPRMSREEWQELDVISKWMVAVRSAVLLMTFISAAIAGLLALLASKRGIVALPENAFWRWLLLVGGLVFAHAANNLINDWTDSARGVDQDNYFRTQYGPQPIQQGLWSKREVISYIAVTGLIAVAAGLPLLLWNGWPAVILMAVGAIFVLFYTWPLKYIGLGEVAVIVIWGPLMIGGGYYVITGSWNWQQDWLVLLASLPFALGATTVLFGKHIDKLDLDKAKRIYTLPVILGEKAARVTAVVMMALMYLTVIVLVILGYFSPVLLTVFLALYTMQRVIPIYRLPKPANRPDNYDDSIWPLWFSAAAFYHNRSFGLIFLLALMVQVFFLS